METRSAKTKVAVSLLALVGLVFTCLIAGGGSLEPNAPPASTMKTLDEIYAAASSSDGNCCPVSGTEFAADDRTFIAMAVNGIPGSGVPGVQGLENAIKVLDVEHTLTVPYDPATCLTSSRRHGPIAIVKNIDKATPGLHRALAQGQNIQDVIITWYRLDGAGKPEAYYRVTLEQVRISEVGPTTNFVTPDSYRHMEKVSLVYQQIQWEWIPESIIEQDQACGGGGG